MGSHLGSKREGRKAQLYARLFLGPLNLCQINGSKAGNPGSAKGRSWPCPKAHTHCFPHILSCCDRKKVVSSLSPVPSDENNRVTRWKGMVTLATQASASSGNCQGKPFPRSPACLVPADIQQHAFFSLPRCRAPSAAHRGPILCHTEAGDELCVGGRGLPPECRQRAHLCLGVLVLRTGSQHSQGCTPPPGQVLAVSDCQVLVYTPLRFHIGL